MKIFPKLSYLIFVVVVECNKLKTVWVVVDLLVIPTRKMENSEGGRQGPDPKLFHNTGKY